MSNYRRILIVTFCTVLAATLTGCPVGVDSTLAIHLSPEKLDFGSKGVELTFFVNKISSTESMPPFTVRSTEPWIELSECLTEGNGCVSMGPLDRVAIPVTVNRSKMIAGNNAGTIFVEAQGIVAQRLEVSARAEVVAGIALSTSSSRVPYTGDPVTFLDASTAITNEWIISGWQWDFDSDGTIDSIERNPAAFRYTTAGSYTVTLDIMAINSQGDSMTERVVEENLIIVSGQIAPTAAFTSATPSPIAGNSVIRFEDKSDLGSSPETIQWEWNFGDATNGPEQIEQNPMHVYELPGVYTVSLTVTTAHGEDTLRKIGFVDVRSELPVAAFSVSSISALANVGIAFTDQSTVGSAPEIESWLWDFGDGTTSTEQNPVHAYSDGGTYSVTLTVETNHGTDESDTLVQITVSENMPQAKFTAEPQRPGVGEDVIFTDTSDPGTSPITSWHWDFGDGATSGLQMPTHAYETVGTYTVSLQVSSAHGSSSQSINNLITVLANIKPTAAFRVNLSDSLYVDDTIQFFDESYIVAGRSAITQWLWDFGDLNTSEAVNPQHAFDTQGSYVVSLTVRSVDGSDIFTSEPIEVLPQVAPVAAFTAFPESGAANLNVVFTNESLVGTSPDVIWTWDFGDGVTSSERNPTHLYTVPSDDSATENNIESYTVTLDVVTGHGADNSSAQITVTGSPDPDLVLAEDTVQLSEESLEANVTIENGAGGLLRWQAQPSDDRISIDPSGEATYIASEDVTISVTSDALEALRSVANLYVTFINLDDLEDSAVVDIEISK